MKSFFFAIQIVILVAKFSTNTNSASVITLIEMIDGIISLSSLNLKEIIRQMNIPTAILAYLTEFDNVALVAGPLFGVILLVLLMLKVVKNRRLT